MPVYLYRAKDWQGSGKEGVITASEMREAARSLRNQGLIVVSLKEYRGLQKIKLFHSAQAQIRKKTTVLKKPVGTTFFKSNPKTRDFMFFCRQFAAMVDAGITILVSLRLLEEQIDQPLLKEKIRDVAQRVEEGNSLTESFRVHSNIFPPIFVNMVEAGETGGVLDTVLKRLAAHFEKQHDLEQKVKSATVYPKFILAVVFAALAFMMVFVLPRFAGMFAGMGIEMPAMTRLVLALGEKLGSYWYLFCLLAAAVFLSVKSYVKTERGLYLADSIRLFLPLYGPVYRKILVARFCRTLSTLLSSGLGLLPALELVKKVTANMVVSDIIARAGEDISKGQPLAEPLAAAGFFPAMVIEMIAIGEQTGKLDSLLEKAAEFFETDVSYVVERLSSLLEPALILLMALVIGFIAISVLLPMLEVFQAF